VVQHIGAVARGDGDQFFLHLLPALGIDPAWAGGEERLQFLDVVLGQPAAGLGGGGGGSACRDGFAGQGVPWSEVDRVAEAAAGLLVGDA
jgi:hypothetical protein